MNDREELALWLQKLATDHRASVAANDPAMRSHIAFLERSVAWLRASAVTDPTNHHNALKCPYCNPDGLVLRSPGVTDEMVEAGIAASIANPVRTLDANVRAIITAAFAAKSSPAPEVSSLPSSGESNPVEMPDSGAGEAYNMRALAKFIYEHGGVDPDKAADIAAAMLSEYRVLPQVTGKDDLLFHGENGLTPTKVCNTGEP